MQNDCQPPAGAGVEVVPPTVVTFVREAMITLREVKKMMNEDMA